MFIASNELTEIIDLRGLDFCQLCLIEHAMINLAYEAKSDKTREEAGNFIELIDGFMEGVGKSESY